MVTLAGEGVVAPTPVQLVVTGVADEEVLVLVAAESVVATPTP